MTRARRVSSGVLLWMHRVSTDCPVKGKEAWGVIPRLLALKTGPRPARPAERRSPRATLAGFLVAVGPEVEPGGIEPPCAGSHPTAFPLSYGPTAVVEHMFWVSTTFCWANFELSRELLVL